ncbi:MAG: ATP-binding protein [Ekhidna sp.]|nr:ATP-binding protein [Ekhidna sp.]
MRKENEQERLENLRSFNVLDTLREADYNDLTSLASYVCQTPISLVSLVDEDRQWFKAKVGLEADETPREHSFCSHAIAGEEDIMVVQDARMDERFRDNPLVVDNPNIVFYAGVPLVSPEGYALGTMCVIDRKTRELDIQQEKALKSIANQVTNLLVMRRQSQELQAQLDKNQFMTKEIHHRVINNLQLVLDLLHFQSANYPDLKEAFGQFPDRIKAIASIHKSLFDSTDDTVNLGSYLFELSKGIMSGLEQGTRSVDLDFDAAEIRLSSKKVLTFGILVNELITNSIKYAFEGRSENRISIEVRSADNGIIELEYKDNGKGFEEDDLNSEKSGFGQELIHSLVDELNGQAELDSNTECGTRYLIKSYPNLSFS